MMKPYLAEQSSAVVSTFILLFRELIKDMEQKEETEEASFFKKTSSVKKKELYILCYLNEFVKCFLSCCKKDTNKVR